MEGWKEGGEREEVREGRTGIGFLSPSLPHSQNRE